MRRTTLAGGAGGIAFGVLTFLSLVIGGAPGGNYTPSDVTKFVSKGHRAGAFVAIYLLLIGVFGLICLLARLREAVSAPADEQGVTRSMFWGTGLAAATSLAIGFCINLSMPIAYAFASNSKFSLTTPEIYAFIEVGAEVALAAGGVLLGISLIVLFLASGDRLPAWLHWVTLIAGILGLASIAFFPWFALLIWSVVAGVWLLASGREASARSQEVGASS
jgi:hypothetical protein